MSSSSRMSASPAPPRTTIEGLISEAGAKKVQAIEIKDGAHLDKLAGEHADAFTAANKASGRPIAPNLTLTWGTICSGGEGVVFVLDAMVKA